MTLDLIISVLEVVGAISIAWATISVHHKFLHEHRVDEAVFRTMRREQKVAIMGVVLVVVSFLLELSQLMLWS